MSKITNIKITSVNDTATHAVACWMQGGARFHFWFDLRTRLIERGVGRKGATIYKNPPLGIKGNDRGYFPTRYLETGSAKNVKVIAHIFEAIDKGDLIRKAVRAAEEARAKRDAKAIQQSIDDHVGQLVENVRWLKKGHANDLIDALASELSLADLDEIKRRFP